MPTRAGAGRAAARGGSAAPGGVGVGAGCGRGRGGVLGGWATPPGAAGGMG
ncbi:MAG: hypothetical protein KatS3mg118_0642 [Paracoccaceae bacterium]|nr:MAG: hypothetical protein KatS3mg118_0642 [Paracoccaceae bacterium]